MPEQQTEVVLEVVHINDEYSEVLIVVDKPEE